MGYGSRNDSCCLLQFLQVFFMQSALQVRFGLCFVHRTNITHRAHRLYLGGCRDGWRSLHEWSFRHLVFFLNDHIATVTAAIATAAAATAIATAATAIATAVATAAVTAATAIAATVIVATIANATVIATTVITGVTVVIVAEG